MMRENTTFDNQIKKKLEELNSDPPDYVWERIQQGIVTPAVKSNIWFKKLYVRLSAAILLMLLLTFGWLYFSNNQSVTDYSIERKVSEKEADILINNQNSIDKNSESTPKVIEQKVNLADGKKIISQQKTKNSDMVNAALKRNGVTASIITPSISNKTEELKNIETSEMVKNVESIKDVNNSEEIIKPIQTQIISQLLPEISTPEDSLKINSENGTNLPEISQENNIIVAPVKPENLAKSELPELNMYQIGIHYGAANMFNTNNQNPAQIPSVSFSYKNLNFVFRTSLSMMYSYEEAEYNMYYKTRVFDKKQNITYDMGSYWDPVSQQYLPIVFQSNSEDVYKVFNDTFTSFAKDKYYNIRVPVLLGYNKSFGKFGYTAFAGIAYTKQVYKNTEGLKELDNNSTLTKLYYPVLQRRTNNLEYLLSANVSYQILPKFTFEFEVQSSFMQNSIYLNPKEKNSINWFAGFGAGLLYQF